MRIGELAVRADSDVDTIRYYEKVGILPKPTRTEGNYRHYSEAHAEQLRFVRYCRALDMTLDEIRVLLQFRDTPEANCTKVNQLLEEHIGHVTTRIAALTELEKELRSLRRKCRRTQQAKDCGILAGIGKGSKATNPRTKRHIAGAH